ncbi:MAG: hypothetical protein HY291_14730 [Planctomycetes bacterium]|nr:hypothetical protein [Planctomycetota bacterium]
MRTLVFALTAVLCVSAFSVVAEQSVDERFQQMEKRLKEVLEGREQDRKRIDELERQNKALTSRTATIRQGEAMQKAVNNAGDKYAGAPKAFLYDGLPAVKGTGLFVDASFLYMKAATDQQTVAFTGSNQGTAPFVSSLNPVGEQKDNDFNYTPAFRVGIGYRLPYPAWDIKAEYTHFKTEGDLGLADNNTADPNYVIADVTMNPNAAPSSAVNVRFLRSKETIKYDTLDFMLGHTSKFDERFDVRFQTGFSYMKYSHDLKVQSSGVSLPGAGHRYSNDQDFRGYGLKFGMEGNFDAGHGFGVYGAGDGVMYVGEYKARIIDQVDNIGVPPGPFGPADVRNYWTRHLDALIPGIQGGAGVTYNHRFGEYLNLKIKIGYEFNHYFGLNRAVVNVNNAVHPPERSNSDVTIHGLAVNFKFDF